MKQQRFVLNIASTIQSYLVPVALFSAALMTAALISGLAFAQDENKTEEKWSSQAPIVQPSNQSDGANADKRTAFQVPPGFQVELLYTVPKDQQGSWVSVTFDPKGRLVASDQGGQGLYRITPPKIGSDEPTKVEKLNAKISSAQGLLFAFDSLYVCVNGGNSGLYRLRDTTGDDDYDEVKKLKAFRGGGEHGPHALRLSPDGQSIYVIAGNHTDPPENFGHSRMLSNWDEDLLLPRQWDANGHAKGKMAPGGWIAATDPDGKEFDIISIGYRNPYDFDFNHEGEIFAYDADMEWDYGAPWYRPTRVCHAISGSEFGWRSGTGKWPTYYADSLPEVVNIGPGSPVGVTFGYGTKFPAKYQKALYILDWTFGTMYAIHLQPQGSSYVGTKEEFVARVALPLTDADVGPDGALYFTVGGRGTQSALYRVTYVGDESTDLVTQHEPGKDLRDIRRELESMHKSDVGVDFDFAWKNLGHADRFIRFAARTAVEKLPIADWQEKALSEPNPTARIHALIGLTRATSYQVSDETKKDASLQHIVAALNDLKLATASKQNKLAALRAYALAFARLGQPSPKLAAEVVIKLDPLFPSDDDDVNAELARVLVYLNAPTAVQKTLALMNRKYEQTPEKIQELLARNEGYGKTITQMFANQPELRNLHYAFVLRNMRYGWTLEERKSYLIWLNEALQWSGGHSYQGFIKNIRNDALENVSENERKALESEIIAKPIPASELPKPIGPGKEWTIDEIVKLASGNLHDRDYESGKRTFSAAKCATCHRFDGFGGATGPDLTSVAARFSLKDLCESIIEPSKVVSDQYRASKILTADGRSIVGRVVDEKDGILTIQVHPEDATQIETVKRDEVEQMEPSNVSLMPEKLLAPLNEKEVLDLIAYMMSRGNPKDLMFAKRE